MKTNAKTLFIRMVTLLVLIMGLSQSGFAGSKNDLDDQTILAIYDQVNKFDVETAELGLKKGHSEEVKSLANMVFNDHSGVRKGVKDLANKLNVKLVLPASRIEAENGHQAVMASLKAKSGTEFDRAYLQHEITFHTAAIQAVREVLLPGATSPKLKEHFQAVLPAFEHHLAMTLIAEKKLNMKRRKQM